MKNLFLFLSLCLITFHASGASAPIFVDGKEATKINTPSGKSVNLGRGAVQLPNSGLLTDGGFEGGTFLDGWTCTGSTYMQLETTASLILYGKKSLRVACFNVAGCSCKQEISVNQQARGRSIVLSGEVRTSSDRQGLRICYGENGTIDNNKCSTPSGQYVFNGTALTEQVVSSTATSVMLEWFIPYNASPTNVYVDNFKTDYGSALTNQPAIGPMTDAGVMTIGAVTTGPSKGTTVIIDKVQYSQIGGMGKFTYSYKQTSAGASAGSGDYLWTLPNSLRFDSSKVTFYNGGAGSVEAYTTYAVGSATTSVSANSAVGVVIPYDATRFRIYALRANSSNQAAYGFIGSGVFPLSSATVSYTADFMVPIEGFASSVPTYTGRCNDPRACETVFSAKVSAAGVVTSENLDFINGNAVITNTATYDLTFNTSLFSVAPSCTVSAVLSSGADSTNIGDRVVSISNTNYIYRITGSGAPLAVPAEIVCQRQGQDYINAKTLQQNVALKSYVQTPNTTGKVGFCSAKISATGVISDQLGGCFASCTNATTPVCTFTSNYWKSGSVPNCWISISPAAGYVPSDVQVTTTTMQGLLLNTSFAAQSGARTYICHGEIQ